MNEVRRTGRWRLRRTRRKTSLPGSSDQWTSGRSLASGPCPVLAPCRSVSGTCRSGHGGRLCDAGGIGPVTAPAEPTARPASAGSARPRVVAARATDATPGRQVSRAASVDGKGNAAARSRVISAGGASPDPSARLSDPRPPRPLGPGRASPGRSHARHRRPCQPCGHQTRVTRRRATGLNRGGVSAPSPT